MHGKEMNARTSLYALALVLLLFFGSWLRFDGLAQQSLWNDELFSASAVLRHPLLPESGQPWLRRVRLHQVQPGDTFWTVKGADQSPPLFELLAKLCVQLLGDDEAALRTASALPAVLALAWLAACAWRRRSAHDAVAWTALLSLMTFSWMLVAYAQEARAYSLGTALLVPLVVRFGQRVAHGWQQAALPGWGEALLGTAACMTHYNAAVLVALLWCAYGVLACRKCDMPAIVRLAIAPLTLAAWLWVAHTGFEAAHKGHIGWMPHMNYGQYLAQIGNGLAAQALGWFAVTTLTAVCALALGAWVTAHSSAPPQVHAQGSALLALLALGLAASLLLAGIVARSRIWHLRHLVFLLPVLYTAAAAALALLAGTGKRALAWILLAALCAAQLPMLHHFHLRADRMKKDYRQAATTLLAHLSDGDVVLLGNSDNTIEMYSYYLGARSGRHMRLREMGSMAQAPETCRLLDEMRELRVGVFSHPFHSETLRVVEQHCAASYEIRTIPFSGTLVRIFTRRAQPPY